MEWILKAGLTAAGVLLVLAAGARCGPRTAGVVAAWPLVTAPTLAWLAHEQGLPFAIGVAVGSVAACAMLAVFALGYAVAARRWCSAVALLAGGAALALMSLTSAVASAGLAPSLALALVVCALVRAAMPRAPGVVAVRRRPPSPPRGAWCVALTVGIFTALLAAIGPGVGDVATGLLSSLPVIGAAVAVLEQRSGGAAAATRFLRGYVMGLFGRAAFGTVFALLAPHCGAVPALLLAAGVAGLMSLSVGGRPPPVPRLARAAE